MVHSPTLKPYAENEKRGVIFVSYLSKISEQTILLVLLSIDIILLLRLAV